MTAIGLLIQLIKVAQAASDAALTWINVFHLIY